MQKSGDSITPEVTNIPKELHEKRIVETCIKSNESFYQISTHDIELILSFGIMH